MLSPHWTTYVQAISTPIIAIIAGGIASVISYRQWQTAKSKVALDLFDKRMEVYEAASDAIFEIIQVGGGNIDSKITSKFASALGRSKFLFGTEVFQFLEITWQHILKLKSNARKQERLPTGEDLDKTFELEDELYRNISVFHENLDRLVIPYMRMDQKK